MEDIRLKGTLTVKDKNEAVQIGRRMNNPITASTNPENVLNVFDKKISTVWEGNKRDYITFALKNGTNLHYSYCRL